MDLLLQFQSVSGSDAADLKNNLCFLLSPNLRSNAQIGPEVGVQFT